MNRPRETPASADRRNVTARRPATVALRAAAAAGAIAVGWFGNEHLARPYDARPVPPPTSAQHTARGAESELAAGAGIRTSTAAPLERTVHPQSDREALLREGTDLANRWPSSLEEARLRAFRLAEADPIAALTLLQPLRGRNLEGITGWEREIMLDWAQRDMAGLLAGLDAVLRDGGFAAEHWISIAASIAQNECRDGLDRMLRWIDDAERAGRTGVSLLATSKLLTHVTADSADALITFLVPRAENPAYRDALVQLANGYAHHEPERALNRIQTFPDPSLRRDALLAVVSAVTWDTPAKVAEWLNSGTLLVNAGLAELSAAEATKLRDEILTAYFTSLVSAHPGYVAQYSSAVADAGARQYLQNMAEVMARTEQVSANNLRVLDAPPATDPQPPPSGTTHP